MASEVEDSLIALAENETTGRFYPEFVKSPTWHDIGKVHDWRNYISVRMRSIWHLLTWREQLVAYIMATYKAWHV